MTNQAMFAVPASELTLARQLSHEAVQWVSRAARANLEARSDDSHSNLGWREDGGAFVSHELDAAKRLQLGFSFASGSLLWLADGKLADSMPLRSVDERAAKAWCDAHLTEAGLRTTDQAEVPYELEPIDYAAFKALAVAGGLATLGGWYSTAQAVLDELVSEFATMAVALPTVRCWPHHFDLATLFFLDGGDPEAARSIGVGLSPGDESYAEPYFYCTPWPTPEHRPDAPGLLHWHTEGFVSLICPASRINEGTNLGQVLTAAVKVAYGML